MTSQQLIQARAALWHHNAEPILTLEDATTWVETQGFLLFLPRRQQLPAPAPSLVEACLGTLEHTPARAAIEDAFELAKRLFASDQAVPLNLFGTLSEEPDFLISREQLPWLLSLRADRSWKSAPGGRTSPLHIKIWKLLDEQGALTVEEIRAGVGREVTEAAVRRGLIDLWGTLRVIPRYAADGTEWTLVKAVYPKESAKGSTTAQGSALSLFLAGYLRSVIAASEDEITSFLSPLASRSKVREVLHALLTTRQLDAVTLGPNTLYHVADELPEFPEAAPADAESADAEGSAFEDTQKPGTGWAEGGSPAAGERIRKYEPRGERPQRPAREGGFQRDNRRPGGYGDRPGRSPRPGGFSRSDRPDRPSRSDRSSRPDRSSREDRPAARSYGRPNPPRSNEGGDRRPPQDRPGQSDRPRFSDRREGSSDRPARSEGGFKPRGDFKPRSEGGFKPRGDFKPRSEGGFKPRGEFKPRNEGGFKPRGDFKPRSGGGFKPRGGEDRRSGGFRPPFRKPQEEGGAFGDNRHPREGEQGRPDFRNREAGDRRPYGKKPFGQGSSGRSFEKRKPFGERAREGREGSRPSQSRSDRPFGDRGRTPREGEGRPPRKSFGGPRREFSDRKPFPPREGRSEGGSEAGPGRRPAGRPLEQRSGDSKPYGDRKPFGDQDRKPGFPKREGGKSFSKGPGKSFGKSFGKGPGKPGRSFGKGPGKGFGKGPGKSFGKPKRRPEE